MKKIRLLLFITLLSNLALSQDSTGTTSNWRLKSSMAINGTQSSFVNWSAGGRNNISLMGAIEASANYDKGILKWHNDLGLGLGGLQYIDKNSTEGLQKTDDKIDFASNLGFKLKEKWYASLVTGFKSQFLDGYTYPNDSVRVSTFMAPGYVNVALGIDFTPNESFTAFLSPVASKMTFVQDRTLADAGAFGVEAAELDSLGNILTPGKMFRYELGAYLKLNYDKTIAKNIELKSKLELFSNYLDRPENIDVNAEMIFNFKVNSWFAASLNLNLMYDHDINITDANGDTGPRTQFKSVIGLGISYTLKNFEEEEE